MIIEFPDRAERRLPRLRTAGVTPGEADRLAKVGQSAELTRWLSDAVSDHGPEWAADELRKALDLIGGGNGV